MRLLLVVLAVVGCRKDAGGKIALRYHPPAGAVYHYVLEQMSRVAMPSAGSPGAIARQEMSLRMYSTHTVKGPAAGGGTEVEIRIDSATMEMPGMPSALGDQVAGLRGSSSITVFDDRFQLIGTDLRGMRTAPPEVVNQMLAVLKGMAYAFPDQPVGRGDSWDLSIELPIEQFGGIDASKAGSARTTLTVREIRVTAADTAVVFDIKTTFPTGPIELTVAGQRAMMTLSGEMTGYQEFSISRGTVVDGTIKGQSMLDISVPTLPMRAMAVTTQTASSIRLTGAK